MGFLSLTGRLVLGGVEVCGVEGGVRHEVRSQDQRDESSGSESPGSVCQSELRLQGCGQFPG